MVHKKSTYRLMYKNYAAEVRNRVWRENNSIRERRRKEEWSHHSIDEDDSDCECDETDEDDELGGALRQPGTYYTQPKSILTQSDEQINQQPSVTGKHSQPPPHIPKLQFSPEQSPRAQQVSDGDSENIRKEPLSGVRDSNTDLNITRGTDESQAPGPPEVKGRTREQLGVMRPGSRTIEYDLIPAVTEDTSEAPRRTTSAKSRMIKSQRYPLTSQLSRTTRKNYYQRNRVNYVPCGTGASVRHIGDKTSYNVHLHKKQVKPTALQASSLRNREIEDLIRKQKTMTLDDWREQGQETQYINHSSLWDDGRRPVLSSRPRVRERLKSAPSRVEAVTNYCKHCGGRK